MRKAHRSGMKHASLGGASAILTGKMKNSRLSRTGRNSSEAFFQKKLREGKKKGPTR